MNVLAIGGHFDDIELGCSGALAKHRSRGDSVHILVVTNSAYTNHDGTLMRSEAQAFSEGAESARILDCDLTCLGYETKHVNFDWKLIEDLNKVIDDLKIDTVYTHWDMDVHQDHSAIGKSSLAAARKVFNILMYQSNLYQNTHPFQANFYVDISAFIEVKRNSILAHKTEVKKFGMGWVDFWIQEAMNNGKKFGVSYAEAFQLVKYLM